jgi:hypothetical protein
MKRFSYVILLAILLTIPLSTRAQLLNGQVKERSDWAFEASVFGNMTNLDMSQVNDHINGAPEYYLGPANPEIVPGIYRYSGYMNQQHFEDLIAYEFRVGFRFQNIHFGMGFTQMPEKSGGYEMDAIDGAKPYEMSVSAREYFAYVGYLHPVNHWLSVGPMISYGFGSISGSVTDFSAEIEDAELFGTHTPFKAEVRGRVQLTRYVSIDVGGGIRNGNVTDFEADYGVDGAAGLPDGRGPVLDYQPDFIELDLSGWFVGGGITLLNPLGLN